MENPGLKCEMFNQSSTAFEKHTLEDNTNAPKSIAASDTDVRKCESYQVESKLEASTLDNVDELDLMLPPVSDSCPVKAVKCKLSDTNKQESKLEAYKDDNSSKDQYCPQGIIECEVIEIEQKIPNQETSGPLDVCKCTELQKNADNAVTLCGYLLKRPGPLKAWKQRWFIFEEEQNSLVYFRTPRDTTPLGKLCLGQAMFTCEGAEPGVFHLHSPERTVMLKAQSEELKFFWLQQLQLKRWLHKLSPDSTTTHNCSNTGADMFPELQSVDSVNTEETVNQPLLLQFSLKHPLIELQNTVQSLRKRSSNDWGQSVFHIPAPPTATLANQKAGTTTANENNSASVPSANTNGELEPKGDSIQATPTPPQVPLLLAPAAPQSPPTGQAIMRRRSRSFLRRNIASWSERSQMQQELQDQKDLVAVLQKALEVCQSERRSQRSEYLDHNRTKEGLNQNQDQNLAQLEELRTTINQKDQIIRDLQNQVRDLSEKNDVKQQVIEKLSERVSQWTERSSDVDRLSVQTMVQQNQQLQDDLQAFKKQTCFLNTEIHQLSALWRQSSEGQRVLMAKVSVLREEYLNVLKELQEVQQGDTAKTQTLQRLIDDVMIQDQNQSQSQANREQDQYGFQLVPDFGVEDIKLLSKIQTMELKPPPNQDALERLLLARWQQFMSGCCGDLVPSPELKTLIRNGIPPRLRPKVWGWIIRTRIQRDHDPLRYQKLCSEIDSCPQSGSRPWSRQIELDLPRTLCTNQNFSSPSSPALQQLRRILLAFSWENPAIGYCQGLNRIAALFLLVLDSEEESFWALKAVVENIMPEDYYSPSLIGSQADQLVLKDFLWEKLPALAAHLDRCGVDLSMATFSWFLVLFVEILPSDILLPLWDAFLYEGSKVLFRFSLALFKLKEADILQLSSSLEIYQYLRVFPQTISDYRRLAMVAFNDLNPFSRRAVRNRRAVHLEHLRRELCDLQQKRSLFMSQKKQKSTEEENEEEEVLDNISEEEDD